MIELLVVGIMLKALDALSYANPVTVFSWEIIKVTININPVLSISQ